MQGDQYNRSHDEGPCMTPRIDLHHGGTQNKCQADAHKMRSCAGQITVSRFRCDYKKKYILKKMYVFFH